MVEWQFCDGMRKCYLRLFGYHMSLRNAEEDEVEEQQQHLGLQTTSVCLKHQPTNNQTLLVVRSWS